MIKYRNTYEETEEVVIISCYNKIGNITGKIIIDKDDFDKVKCYQWHVENSRPSIKYAQASISKGTIRLHKLIMSSNLQIDHINHNGLDNRKCNLRVCTNAENNRNKDFKRNPLSGHRGIRYNPKTQSYYVRIMVNKKEISLGAYKTIEDAIKARIRGEEKYFGNFRYKELTN